MTPPLEPSWICPECSLIHDGAEPIVCVPPCKSRAFTRVELDVGGERGLSVGVAAKEPRERGEQR